MIVVIPRTDPQCKPGQEPDWEWLPRTCPACDQTGMIGHGRRWKQAHAPQSARIRVRRAICKLCDLTCTILPAWSLPYTQYALQTRRQSAERYMAGKPLEEAAPVLRDPDHSPDESTLRRWFRRRIAAAASCLGWLAAGLLKRTPTILAWDFGAALRILIPETKRDAQIQSGP